MKCKLAKFVFLLASIVAAAPSFAQGRVDTQTGACTDSTCSRRALYVSTMGLSTSSGTYVPPENNCIPNSKKNPAVSCPSGYTGTMSTETTTSCPGGRFGPRQTYTTGYDMSGCTFSGTPGPGGTPPAPLPSCTEADNIDPAFYTTGDADIKVYADPSWPDDFCDYDNGVRVYSGAIQTQGTVFSMYNCQSGVKRKVMLSLDGKCQRGWFDNPTFSTVRGSTANLEKFENQFMTLHPDAVR